MKHQLLALASGLSFAALSAHSFAQNLATLPTTTTLPNTQGPCGNPSQPETPDCPDCDEENTSQFTPPAGSSCDTNSIYSYNGNAHRKITDLSIAGSVGRHPLRFTRFSNTRLSGRNLA
jgi:hypothetical protein